MFVCLFPGLLSRPGHEDAEELSILQGFRQPYLEFSNQTDVLSRNVLWCKKIVLSSLLIFFNMYKYICIFFILYNIVFENRYLRKRIKIYYIYFYFGVGMVEKYTEKKKAKLLEILYSHKYCHVSQDIK